MNELDVSKYLNYIFSLLEQRKVVDVEAYLSWNSEIKEICKILLKTEFYNAWRFVPLLLLAAMFGCISTYFGTFYQALKKMQC